MRSHRIPTWLVLAGLAVGCQGAGPLSDADVSALRADIERFAKLVNASDWAALAGMYAENAVFMPPHQPAVQGRANIQKWMAAFPKLQRFSLQAQDIGGHGDVAYLRGTYSMTLAPEGNAPAANDVGKYLDVRRKQPNGSWLTVEDTFNSDLPVAAPAPSKPAKATPAKKPARRPAKK
jgi:ketosteroid isomerase-like protein